MNSYVVDASVAVKWMVEEDLSSESASLLDAGLTATEVAGLTVQDFDADTGAITVKNQVIYLPNDRLRAHPPFRSRYVRSRRR